MARDQLALTWGKPLAVPPHVNTSRKGCIARGGECIEESKELFEHLTRGGLGEDVGQHARAGEVLEAAFLLDDQVTRHCSA